MFANIRATHARNPNRVLSAYHDNASVTSGAEGYYYVINRET